MPSKDLILIGVAVWLVLKMNNASANQRLGNTVRTPTGNQNADMWLKTGALKLGSDLLKELGKGTFSKVFNTTDNQTMDYGLPAGLGATDVFDTPTFDYSGYA